MTAKYFAILTNYGAAQLANAVALGTQMNITAMGAGDGGGTLSVPDPAQTTLIHENRRAAVNQVSVDDKNPNIIIAEQVIPENEGGWWIREIGLYDDKGGLIAIGNAPETYKPNLQEGSGRTQVLQMALIVSSTQAVTLKVDPSVVLATREYVTKSIDAAIQASEDRAAQTYQPKGDYVTNPYLKLEMLKKIDKADIAQQLGNDTAKVPSLQLVTTELGKKAGIADVAGKLDKSAVVQTTGISATDVMSQKAVSQALDQKASVFSLSGKIDNTSVTNDLGTSSSLIMSQKGVTENCVPVGTVIFVSHNKPVIGRFLKTVGPAVSRTMYADLFAVVGTTYGSGDGSTTFNLPDTRDEFPRFTGDSRAVGSKQGDATRNFTGMVSGRTSTNSARIFSSSTAGVFSVSGTDGAMVDNGSGTSPSPADRMNTLTIDGSRQLPVADEIRPRNIAFVGWIKY
ncbi:phage tail protein [Morganella morganii]|uniref:phage tail-collar fiber domain-containing protein n=1 Tax=Morganella morganii TaxID=582 RepID=UPI0004685F01|nr:phage tail protein [Morganella morganii]